MGFEAQVALKASAYSCLLLSACDVDP